MSTEWNMSIHDTIVFIKILSLTLVLTVGFSTLDRWIYYGVIGNIERSIFFFIGSFITRMVVTGHQTRMQILCWAVSAIVLEVARQWMSGHSNGITGWLASMAGIVVGAVSARYIAHAHLAPHAFWR